jgi:hypothetical protein
MGHDGVHITSRSWFKHYFKHQFKPLKGFAAMSSGLVALPRNEPGIGFPSGHHHLLMQTLQDAIRDHSLPSGHASTGQHPHNTL